MKNVHSISLSFRLRLSLSVNVNSRMAIPPYTSHLNYHSAINIFYFDMSGQIAIELFSKQFRKFLNSWMAIRPYTSHWLFTLKLKCKRNLRHSKHTEKLVWTWTSYSDNDVVLSKSGIFFHIVLMMSHQSVCHHWHNVKLMLMVTLTGHSLHYSHRHHNGIMLNSNGG